ncbi:ATP-binding protein [Streptomyces sp. NPDC001380]|uniref:ATP-binding protein n=1 Tax=Streptomyces sp. NPDC001380 TaxID=3364566 RepID=UPI0036C88EEE
MRTTTEHVQTGENASRTGGPQRSGATWQTAFSPSPGAVGQARALVRRELAARGVTGDTAEDAVLVVSELLTNAVRHADHRQGAVELAVTACGGDVLVEVTDPCPRRPVLPAGPAPAAGPQQEGGRGLPLVHALAEACGVRGQGPGKTVWAILAGSGGGEAVC